MPTIGNLLMSLCRRCAVPTSPTLRHIFLHRYRPALVDRVPLVACCTSLTTPSSSKLVLSGELTKFPLGMPNFNEIRQSGLAYFDKTKYIVELEASSYVQLVCRPRRFGKSLTVAMLRCFHGFQYRDQYDKLFKGLDVDEAVKNGTVQPGQYLVLQFDFSRVARLPDIDESTKFLGEEINLGLSRFKNQYADDLGESFASGTSTFKEDSPVRNFTNLTEAVDRVLQGVHSRGDKGHSLWDVRGIYLLADEYDAYANEYMGPHNPRSWSDAEPFRVLKAFWSTVKAGSEPDFGIKKVYITGVAPLLLDDLVSGANEQDNISFNPRISTICGLTQSDVLGALRVICENEEEVQKHFTELQNHANGYHFCQKQIVEPVFNTQTILHYLEALRLGDPPEAEDPQNSEVSECFLQACARAPAAVNDMQFALQRDEHGSFQRIPCEKVLRSFKLSQLNLEAAGHGDMSAWRSLMVYMGGLTFDSDDPSKFLKIPNLVAGKRIGLALLARYGLDVSMKNALYILAGTGNPVKVLAGYCVLMRRRDVIEDTFTKTEEDHRDSIWVTILENPAIKPVAEYQVRKWTDKKGFIGLLITDKKNHYTVIEFKNIQIPYLNLKGRGITDKVKELEAMELEDILELKFKDDKFRSGTVGNWIDGNDPSDPKSGSVREQLRSYITGATLQEEIAGQKFRAWAVVIIGSRQILMREMDEDGNWVGKFSACDGCQRMEIKSSPEQSTLIQQ